MLRIKSLFIIIGFVYLLTGCVHNNSNIIKSEEQQVISLDDMINQPNKVSYNTLSKYDIYSSVAGNINLIQVLNIEKNHIQTTQPILIDFKKSDRITGAIALASKDKIYCSVFEEGGKFGNGKRIIALKDGTFCNEIYFKNSAGPGEIINDVERNRAYVCMKSKGNPVNIIDTSTDAVVGKMDIKGFMQSFDLNETNIYAAIYGAEKMDYKDVPDCYLLRINRTTGKAEVLPSNNANKFPQDLKISPNGKIYTVNCPLLYHTEETKEFKLSVYDLAGNFIKDIMVDPWPYHIAIDTNGIAYISHRGAEELYDDRGSQITVFDTNQDKVISNITGFHGPSDLIIKDHFLFVLNNGSSSITVVDTNSGEIWGSISLGSNTPPDSLVVLAKNP
ncbi:MAG TPA: hypothetical protein VN426_17965 [Syntrophomonadaceae bacterium]|nr:hypothetical protein [Syntrophomonadaceae bacterium]